MINNFPQINGLAVRNVLSDTDYQAMLQVKENSKKYDGVDEFSVSESIPTVEKLAKIITEDHCNPATDVLLVEINKNVIGYVRVAWWLETDGTWLFLHNEYLLPKLRNTGIDESMLQWAETRIRSIAKEQQANGKLMYGTNATDTEKEKMELITRHGYKSVFSQIEMEISNVNNVKQIPLPQGFEIKPVLPAHLQQIWELNNDAYTNRDFISVPTEVEFQEFKDNPLNEYSLWIIAWKNDEIAGFVLSQIEKGRGEITQVSVREKYRRKGLAYALLIENLLRLQSKGVEIVRLDTSGENIAGAKSLYEKVGFKLIKTHVRYRKEFSL